MSVKGPVRSAGICQKFADFSKIDDLTHAARSTGGVYGNPLNFDLTIKPDEWMRASEFHNLELHSVERTHGFNPNVGRGPDMPHPRPRQRDDLEQEFASKFKPRPF